MGITIKRNMYLWDNLSDFRLDDHNVNQRTLTSISFSYGFERISMRVGWQNKAVAMSVLKGVRVQEDKYRN